MPDNNTAKRISDATGTLWAYIQNWAARGISLLVFFVLVRVLSPAEFGTFAITMVFITVGEIFVEQLFGHAIVQRKELTESHLSSAFWATLLIGLALTAGSLAAAPYFATAFDSPGAAPLIMAITPVFIFMALNSVPAALLFRELDYRTLTRRTALSNLLSGIAAIAAAIAGWGVWTFVLQQLVFQAVSTAVLWHSEAWRPKKIFNIQALGELFSFSSRVTAGKLLDLVETRVVELIIARYLGIVAVGNFSVAARAQTAATQLLAAPLWTSSIPIFARRQENRDDLLNSLRERSLLAALFVAPAFLFAAATAESLVPTVFGRQWLGSIVAFQFLCLLISVRSVTAMYGAVLQATGSAGSVARNTLVRALSSVFALPFLMQYGPSGAAASLLLGQLFSIPFIFNSLYSKLGWPPMKLISQILKPTFSAAVAAFTGLVTTRLVAGTTGNFAGLVAGAFACVVTFTVFIAFLAPGSLMKFTGRLPTSIGSQVNSILDSIIRLKDSLRVATYVFLMKTHDTKESAKSEHQDLLLVFSDCYSIVGSVGDQALFGGLVDVIRQAGASHARVICRPGVVLPEVEGITFQLLPIWGDIQHAREVRKQIRSSSALIVVGADIMDGFYSRFEALLRLEIVGYAANQNVPSIICSFSFNESPDKAVLRAFRNLPVGVTILCRDVFSRDRLIKVTGDRVGLTADLAFLLKPSLSSEIDRNVSAWLTDGHRNAGPVIAWNMSPHSLMLLSKIQQTCATEACATVIRRLVVERNSTVILVPHDFRSHASDPAMLKAIYSCIPEPTRDRVLLAQGPYAAADVKQICAHFDLVVTGRMHLMIAALGRDVPVLAVEYQGKFAGMLSHFGLGKKQLMEPSDVCSSEKLYQRVSDALNNLAETRGQIQKLRPTVQSMAAATLLLKLGK